jgi:hypothetical protein
VPRPKELMRTGSSNRDRMSEERLKSPKNGLRIVVEFHLVQHASPVVVNALTGKRSRLIKRIKPA